MRGVDTSATLSFWNLHSTAFQQGGLCYFPPQPLERVWGGGVHRAIEKYWFHWSNAGRSETLIWFDLMRQLLCFLSCHANDLCTQLEEALPEGLSVLPKRSLGLDRKAGMACFNQCPQSVARTAWPCYGWRRHQSLLQTPACCQGSLLVHWARSPGWPLDAAFLWLLQETCWGYQQAF